MKLQSCTNIWEISTKSSVPQRKIRSSRLKTKFQTSKTTQGNALITDLFEMFLRLNIYGGGLEPYKPSGYYGPDCWRGYFQFDWNSYSQYLYIKEVLWEWLKSIWWKRFLKKAIKVLGANTVFLLWSKLSLI